MNENYSVHLERRINQSYKINELYDLLRGVELLPRIYNPQLKQTEKSQLRQIDKENIYRILKTVGVNSQPIGTGKYVHQVEMAKIIGVFANDATGKQKEQRDSGTIRVESFMASVNKNFRTLERLTLANLPSAGYRIASNEEAVLEVKKSIHRSAKSMSSAFTKSSTVVDTSKLHEKEKQRFIEIRKFAIKIVHEFEIEFGKFNI